MTTDLSKTSSEVVENNSLREVILFCVVLVIEIYSLAVAFGGPFFEVGYFLLVVISQTFAGAYIWAQLRQSDKTLPLPELLAMGFAIGSASAAISQLIIRDLLDIRLFFSPLVPIIGVAIWLFTKRDSQMPVKVTHATTNTLLWLLLPIPVTLMKNNLTFIPLYVIPLFFLILRIHKIEARKTTLTGKTFVLLSTNLLVLASVLNFINKQLPHPGSGIARIISDDIRTDIAQSVGFFTWGLNTNVELVNYTNAYYKIAHLWIGPIIKSSGSLAINITALVSPYFLILVIALALWTFTYRLSINSKAASIGSLLFFAQADIQDTFELNFRFVWLLGAVYLISFGLMVQHLIKRPSFFNNLGLVVIGFLIAGTRITLFPMMLAVANTSSTLNPRSMQRILRDQFKLLITLLTGVLIALLVFIRGTNSTLLDYMLITASEWPINLQTSLTFAINSTIGRTFLFLGVLMFAKKFNFRILIMTSIAIYLSTTLLVPRIAVNDAALLFPFLLVVTPVIACLCSDAYTNQLLSRSLVNFQIFFGLSIGLMHKVIFDMYREIPTSETFLRTLQYWLITNSLRLTFSLLICALILVGFQLFRLKLLKRELIIASLVITMIASNAGVFLGSSIRPITEYFRFGESIWSREPDPQVTRWSDPTLLNGLSVAKSITDFDDIIASNFGLIRGNGPDDNLRFQLYINRRFYVSSRYEYFLDSFPLMFRNKYRQTAPNYIAAYNLSALIKTRINTSMDFPNYPSRELLANMRKENVKWFVVDLTNTTLRDWEPWATTRFINEKVAILELAQAPVLEPSN